MAKITNDIEMRDAIHRLNVAAQRTLAMRFVNAVREFTDNDDLLRAIATAMEPDVSASALESAYRTAKSISVATYTACGQDADWLAQAEHFVAAACAAALAPVTGDTDRNPAWKAAMQARMARTCGMIENPDGQVDNEAGRQYEIVEAFLG
jgi:hypothetical protein